MTLAILASLILWPLYLAVFIPLAIVGLVILAPLSLLRMWYGRPSKVWPDRPVAAWRGAWLTWPWGNEEDGVHGPEWWEHRNGTFMWPVGMPKWRFCLKVSLAAYRWSALRNPVNNLRFIPVLCPRIEPTRIRSRTFWVRNWGGAFTWQGPYAGLIWFPVIRGQVFRFWLGWKLKPEDAQGVADDDMRKVRCGFAIQLKRI